MTKLWYTLWSSYKNVGSLNAVALKKGLKQIAERELRSFSSNSAKLASEGARGDMSQALIRYDLFEKDLDLEKEEDHVSLEHLLGKLLYNKR